MVSAQRTAAVSIRCAVPVFSRAVLLTMGLLVACAQVPLYGVSSPVAGAMAYALDGPSSSPAVVLQSGLGDGRTSWAPVWNQLTIHHRVFAPDRPGYGDTPSTTTSRDPCRLAAELRSALREAQVPPPYLLVGHSLGGLYQYVFARLYPEDTAGLLLLDPTHPDHLTTLQQESPSVAFAIRGLRATVFTSVMRAEFDAQSVCLDSISRDPLTTIPSRLLVSTRFGALQGESFQRVVVRLRADWQRLLGAPAVEAVPRSGHYIHHDAPALVKQTIDAMIADYRPPSHR